MRTLTACKATLWQIRAGGVAKVSGCATHAYLGLELPLMTSFHKAPYIPQKILYPRSTDLQYKQHVQKKYNISSRFMVDG
jgi:hypothetical protein